MSALLRGVFVVGAKRTPIGSFGGKLKDITATDLAVISSKAAIEASKLTPDDIDNVIFGNVISCSAPDGILLARHVGLKTGVKICTPSLTVNRLCGSGFQAVVSGAQEICLRESEIVLTGGSENMSQVPFALRGARFGTKLGSPPPLEDSLWVGLSDSYCNMPMGITAENLAVKYELTREECDKFALRSQTNWKKAQSTGVFKEELVSVKLKIKGKEVEFSVDEHPKPDTTLETLAKLKAVFKKNGTVTAGNASGISDGAASVVLASEDAVRNRGLTPLARIVGYSYVGCDPTIMGIGPAAAIRLVCERTGIKLQDIDLIEVNEAFAPQFLAVEKELGLDPSKTNVNGGAIAMGHPIGTSGARIIANLAHDLRRRGGKYALGSACIGGGQGIAVILEKM